MTRPSDPSQRGVSLIVVLLILVVVSVLGVGGAQIATMAERGSRNDRDMQVAWQSAEAALTDAEFDIHGPNTAAGNRRSVFKDMRDINLFVAGCGTSGTSKGLCTLVETGKPAWLTVDFTIDAATARTTALGTFTGRGFAAVGAGQGATLHHRADRGRPGARPRHRHRQAALLRLPRHRHGLRTPRRHPGHDADDVPRLSARHPRAADLQPHDRPIHRNSLWRP
jgi:Tfp pilus assembly protein PilX